MWWFSCRLYSPDSLVLQWNYLFSPPPPNPAWQVVKFLHFSNICEMCYCNKVGYALWPCRPKLQWLKNYCVSNLVATPAAYISRLHVFPTVGESKVTQYLL